MQLPRKIRLLVVDDSALVRRLIPEALKHEQDIEVVGTAVDPYNACDLILELEPDILTLDIEMPRMDGLTFLKILMEKHPMPVIILSSLTQKGSAQAVEALRLGAMQVLPKPKGSFSLGETGQVLGECIREIMLAARQGRHRAGLAANAAAGGMRVDAARLPTQWHPRQIGLIGASTGGTEAIRNLVSHLPAHFPGLCIVQHIPAFISKAFAERVDAESELSVREASHGDQVLPGQVLIAPGDYHMVLHDDGTGIYVHLKKGPKVWYQRPAVDVMYASAVGLARQRVVAVLLTGMGKDGAEGMLRLKQAGAHTIVQDEASCVVYGMPRAAYELGAHIEQLPLSDIPTHMTRAFLGQLGR